VVARLVSIALGVLLAVVIVLVVTLLTTANEANQAPATVTGTQPALPGVTTGP
jgi:hypothetical protein